MSAHVDPVPREARPFQGHRGSVTRTAAAAIDLGLVIIALGACYLGVLAFLFLRKPPQFHRSDAVVCVGVCRRRAGADLVSCGVLDG